DALARSGSNGDPTNVRVSDASVDFAAGQNWHFEAVDKADAAAEVRNHILVQSQAKRKDVVALDKERALFRKEQRKASQVRASSIDLCFGEVGVHGSGGEHVRSQPLI